MEEEDTPEGKKAKYFRLRGNHYFNIQDFDKALHCYRMGISFDENNSVLYSNMSQAHLALHLYIEAEDDANKAIELDIDNPKGYFRAAKAAMGLGNTAKAMQYLHDGLKRRSLANNCELKNYLDELLEQAKREQSKHKSSGQEPTTTLIKNNKENGETCKGSLIKEKVKGSKENEAKGKGKGKTGPIESKDISEDRFLQTVESLLPKQTPTQVQKRKMVLEFYSTVKDGSELLLKGLMKTAATKYKVALDILAEYPPQSLDVGRMEEVVLKYSLSWCWLQSKDYQSMAKAIEYLTVIREKNASQLPAVYFALGNSYFKLNRFHNASKFLEKGLTVIRKKHHFDSYFWPGTETTIKETTSEGLQESITELLPVCKQFHPPDAICKYDKDTCFSISNQIVPSEFIFFSDPDFVGFVVVICQMKCKIQYHLACWKDLKESESLNSGGKVSDKDMLGWPCPTDDCVTTTMDPSVIVAIQVMGENGVVKSQCEREPVKPKVETVEPAPKEAKKPKKKTERVKSATATNAACPTVEKEKPKSKPRPPLPAEKKPASPARTSTRPLVPPTKPRVTMDHPDEFDDEDGSEGLEVRQDSDEIIIQQMHRQQLRTIEVYGRDIQWQPTEAYYGREDLDPDKWFMTKSATACQDFIFSFFYDFLNKDGPQPISEIEDRWESEKKDCEQYRDLAGREDFPGIIDYLSESYHFVVANDYIGTCAQAPDVFEIATGDIADCFDFLIQDYTPAVTAVSQKTKAREVAKPLADNRSRETTPVGQEVKMLPQATGQKPKTIVIDVIKPRVETKIKDQTPSVSSTSHKSKAVDMDLIKPRVETKVKDQTPSVSSTSHKSKAVDNDVAKPRVETKVKNQTPSVSSNSHKSKTVDNDVIKPRVETKIKDQTPSVLSTSHKSKAADVDVAKPRVETKVKDQTPSVSSNSHKSMAADVDVAKPRVETKVKDQAASVLSTSHKSKAADIDVAKPRVETKVKDQAASVLSYSQTSEAADIEDMKRLETKIKALFGNKLKDAATDVIKPHVETMIKEEPAPIVSTSEKLQAADIGVTNTRVETKIKEEAAAEVSTGQKVKAAVTNGAKSDVVESKPTKNKTVKDLTGGLAHVVGIKTETGSPKKTRGVNGRDTPSSARVSLSDRFETAASSTDSPVQHSESHALELVPASPKKCDQRVKTESVAPLNTSEIVEFLRAGLVPPSQASPDPPDLLPPAGVKWSVQVTDPAEFYLPPPPALITNPFWEDKSILNCPASFQDAANEPEPASVSFNLKAEPVEFIPGNVRHKGRSDDELEAVISRGADILNEMKQRLDQEDAVEMPAPPAQRIEPSCDVKTCQTELTNTDIDELIEEWEEARKLRLDIIAHAKPVVETIDGDSQTDLTCAAVEELHVKLEGVQAENRALAARMKSADEVTLILLDVRKKVDAENHQLREENASLVTAREDKAKILKTNQELVELYNKLRSEKTATDLRLTEVTEEAKEGEKKSNFYKDKYFASSQEIKTLKTLHLKLVMELAEMKVSECDEKYRMMLAKLQDAKKLPDVPDERRDRFTQLHSQLSREHRLISGENNEVMARYSQLLQNVDEADVTELPQVRCADVGNEYHSAVSDVDPKPCCQHRCGESDKVVHVDMPTGPHWRPEEGTVYSFHNSRAAPPQFVNPQPRPGMFVTHPNYPYAQHQFPLQMPPQFRPMSYPLLPAPPPHHHIPVNRHQMSMPPPSQYSGQPVFNYRPAIDIKNPNLINELFGEKSGAAGCEIHNGQRSRSGSVGEEAAGGDKRTVRDPKGGHSLPKLQNVVPIDRDAKDFTRLLEELKKRHPLHSMVELQRCVETVRDRDDNLSGMPFSKINSVIAAELEERAKARKNAWGQVKSDVTTWKPEHVEEDCVICMEKMNKQKSHTLDCQHTFHQQCIKLWLGRNSVCPMCNRHSKMSDEYPPLK